ncbi:MAG TPA: hypothetical protein VEW03_12765 [Longimicrobiaceae bacterium]|nr:hypothetical protein [Longimicrobiaceae bacterium]
MRLPRAVLPLLALAAATACDGSTTAPTDQDLVGTWSIEPSSVIVPGGGVQQMTVRFGGRGDYTLETATYGGAGAAELVAYDKTVGSVTTEDGALRLHPSGAVSWDRRSPGYLDLPLFDTQPWQRLPLSYQVSGDQLVLRLPRGNDSMVLSRRDE